MSTASQISLTISPAKRAEVEATLSGIAGGAAWVMRNSLKDAATSGRTLMVDTIKEHLNLPETAIRKRVTIPVLPHGASLEAVIRISYAPVKLQEFKGAGTGKRVNPVTTIIGSAPVTQSHGFRATMKTGHRGIFRRSKLIGAGQLNEGHVRAANPNRDFSSYEMQSELNFARRHMFGSKQGYYIAGGRATFQRFRKMAASGYAGRLPIEDTFGPAVVTVMDRTPGLEERVTVKIMETLGDRIESKMDLLVQTGKIPGRGGA